jgi:septal ring factor EnvC (AmiA/AmiB activator)
MLIQIGIEKRDLILPMKKAIVYSSVFLASILTLFCFKTFAASSLTDVRQSSKIVKSGSKYSAILKRLYFYKRDLAFLSSKIFKEEKGIKDLKNKIKNSEGKIKKLRNKIKKDGLLIKVIVARIFIIHKEYGSAKLLSFKDDTDGFIINYQLKTLLKEEETKLSKLVNRKNKFLKLKNYLKKEKNSLVLAVKSIDGTKIKLEDLIGGINNYIKSVKIKYKHKHNKNNRLLRRKVIKLIHNLNGSSKKNDIKFIIMR